MVLQVFNATPMCHIEWPKITQDLFNLQHFDCHYLGETLQGEKHKKHRKTTENTGKHRKTPENTGKHF